MRNLPVRAAGSSLSVGELRDALEGLDDADEVIVNGKAVYTAEPWDGALHLSSADVGNSGRRPLTKPMDFLIPPAAGEVA